MPLVSADFCPLVSDPCQCPRQESNLVCDLRKVACDPAHPEDVVQYPDQDSNLD